MVYRMQKIELKLIDVLGFPEATSYEGGYDIICRLLIQVGSYQINYAVHSDFSTRNTSGGFLYDLFISY
jgi:hypothetical protein